MIGFARHPEDIERLAALELSADALRDDGRDYTALVVEKPWGHEIQTRGTPEYAATRLELRGDAETSMHCHPHKTVLLVVIRGSLRIERLNGSHWQLFAGTDGNSAIVERGVFHRLRAGHAGAAVMEVEFPPNKRDLVRLEDAYGRAGQGYERAAG